MRQLIKARTFLSKFGIALLVAYVFITAYGTTRQWMESGTPFRQECIRPLLFRQHCIR